MFRRLARFGPNLGARLSRECVHKARSEDPGNTVAGVANAVVVYAGFGLPVLHPNLDNKPAMFVLARQPSNVYCKSILAP